MHRIFVIALVAFAGSAFAEPRYTAAYTPCMERSGGVTSAMIQCIGDEFVLQDRRLNATYKKVLAALPAQRRPALVKAQRAWIAFKQADCGFAYDPDGGSAARIVANDCNLRMTAERADQLDTLLQSLVDR